MHCEYDEIGHLVNTSSILQCDDFAVSDAVPLITQCGLAKSVLIKKLNFAQLVVFT